MDSSSAVPLTGGMCVAVADRIEGSVANQLLGEAAGNDVPIRLGTPSGIIPVGAKVGRDDGVWFCERVTVYRTARRLMEGRVLLPEIAQYSN